MTLNVNIDVSKMSFLDADGYALTGGGMGGVFDLAGSGLSVDAVRSATISVEMDIDALDQEWCVASGKTLTLGATMYGGGGTNVIKSGAGTLLLNGNNWGWGGTMTISSGAVKLGHDDAFGLSGSSMVIHCNTGYLDLNGCNVGHDRHISIVDDASVVSEAIQNTSANTASYCGTISIATGAYIGGTGQIALGDIAASNSWLCVYVTGTPGVVLNGTNSLNWLGVCSGTLKLGSSLAVSAATQMSLWNNGILDLSGCYGNATVGKFFSQPGQTGTVHLGDRTLTFGDGTDQTFAGVIDGNGGSLVKQGAGTEILTGSNTYTGTTTVTPARCRLAAVEPRALLDPETSWPMASWFSIAATM